MAGLVYLTPAQHDILCLMMCGKGGVDICEWMDISRDTLKVHSRRMFRVLHVDSHLGAMLWAWANHDRVRVRRTFTTSYVKPRAHWRKMRHMVAGSLKK